MTDPESAIESALTEGAKNLAYEIMAVYGSSVEAWYGESAKDILPEAAELIRARDRAIAAQARKAALGDVLTILHRRDRNWPDESDCLHDVAREVRALAAQESEKADG